MAVFRGSSLHLRIKLLTVSCLSLRYRPVFHVSLFSPASLSNFQLLSSLWVTRQYLCVHLTFPRVLSSSAHLPLQITHGNLCDDTWWFIQWKALCTLPLPVCCSTQGGMESSRGIETLFHSLSWSSDREKNWTNGKLYYLFVNITAWVLVS